MGAVRSDTFSAGFILVDIDEDDIAPDLNNATPRNKKFEITAQKAAELSRTRNNQCGNAAGTAVYLQIADAS